MNQSLAEYTLRQITVPTRHDLNFKASNSFLDIQRALWRRGQCLTRDVYDMDLSPLMVPLTAQEGYMDVAC